MTCQLDEDDDFEPTPLVKPLRLIELILSALCLGLLMQFSDQMTNKREVNFMFVTFGSCIVVSAADVISQCCGYPIGGIPMAVLNLVHGALFLGSGGISAKMYNFPDKFDVAFAEGEGGYGTLIHLLSTTILCMFSGFLLLIDASLSYRYG